MHHNLKLKYHFHWVNRSFLLLLILNFIPKLFSQPTYIDERTGVTISFVPGRNMFPVSWMIHFHPRYEKLSEDDYSRTKKIIKKALDKYPVDIIKSNLNTIYVLETLSFDSVGYGGTYTEDAVFIVNSGEINGYDDLYVEQTFHHEFSSVLYNNYVARFAADQTAWSDCNGDAEYGDGGFEAIKNGEDGMYFDEELNVEGFLFQYGQSDMENDFNSFAENLFAPSEGFWDLMDEYPLIKCKADLLIKLYSILDPQFTREYFKSFDQ